MSIYLALHGIAREQIHHQICHKAPRAQGCSGALVTQYQRERNMNQQLKNWLDQEATTIGGELDVLKGKFYKLVCIVIGVCAVLPALMSMMAGQIFSSIVTLVIEAIIFIPLVLIVANRTYSPQRYMKKIQKAVDSILVTDEDRRRFVEEMSSGQKDVVYLSKENVHHQSVIFTDHFYMQIDRDICELFPVKRIEQIRLSSYTHVMRQDRVKMKQRFFYVLFDGPSLKSMNQTDVPAFTLVKEALQQQCVGVIKRRNPEITFEA